MPEHTPPEVAKNRAKAKARAKAAANKGKKPKKGDK